MADGRTGRPKGSTTKLGDKLRLMVFRALKDAGGRKYLAAQAVENPTAFMSLISKLIPRDVTVAGEVKYSLEELILGKPVAEVSQKADERPAQTSH